MLPYLHRVKYRVLETYVYAYRSAARVNAELELDDCINQFGEVLRMDLLKYGQDCVLESYENYRIRNALRRSSGQVLLVVIMLTSFAYGFAITSFSDMLWASITATPSLIAYLLLISERLRAREIVWQKLLLIAIMATIQLLSQKVRSSVFGFEEHPHFAASGWISFATFLATEVALQFLDPVVQLDQEQYRDVAREILQSLSAWVDISLLPFALFLLSIVDLQFILHLVLSISCVQMVMPLFET